MWDGGGERDECSDGGGERGECGGDGGECRLEGASKVSAVVVVVSAGWRLEAASGVNAVVVVVVSAGRRGRVR